MTNGSIAFHQLIMLDATANADAEKETTQALYDCCNEEQPNGTGKAVLAGLQSQGYEPGQITDRVPFSSARKWSAVVKPDGIWTMGAPEVMISALDGDYADVLDQVNAYANDGNRVLLVARSLPQSATPTAPSSEGADEMDSLVSGKVSSEGADIADSLRLDPHAKPIALVLCAEQIRVDAEQTLAWFREQGVRCRVISGDNPVTVGAIARKVKLTGEREPVAMDARKLPDDVNELARVLENVDVLGRVLPNQKKAIVEALHAQGHVVAMTGDGVNDALAIKEADLGIAMGNAAPATKAVAQVVLVDSKFSHLPDVVARGRQVMANMERVASLFLVKTVYSALISLGVVLTQIPYPYLPRHITYIGALTIGMPAFILALAPNTRRYIPGFLKRVVKFALPGGIATALSVLMAAWVLPNIMGWNVISNDADLAAQRATSAIILFVMGVFVLARVARPLNSWRGALVAVFAAAGVIGAFIPFVAQFFALMIPTGATLLATVIALASAAVIFALCLWLVPLVGHAAASMLRRHGFTI
ncbi:HAD-IC family P-type ATPase [Bifidobacterium felsineum]|uniref:HAD-IC family P-type ATPase n=1 Tax=Bifidobacterium felsineum TaxID=2045440 RepID=UPI003B8458D0